MSDRNRNAIIGIIVTFSLLLNVYMFNTNISYESLINIYEEKIDEYEQEITVFSDKMISYEKNITNILFKLNDFNDTNKSLLDDILNYKNNSTYKYVIPYLFKAQEVLQDGDLSIYSPDKLYDIANRYGLVITNYYPQNKEPIKLLKEINPSIKVLMYVNVHSIDST